MNHGSLREIVVVNYIENYKFESFGTLKYTKNGTVFSVFPWLTCPFFSIFVLTHYTWINDVAVCCMFTAGSKMGVFQKSTYHRADIG
jgi:hypothetical protein